MTRFSKEMAKAIDKKTGRRYFENVFYSAKNKEYVATNGHVMLIQKTDDGFESDCMLNPVTQEVCPNQKEVGVDYFPKEYRRVYPEQADEREVEFYKEGVNFIESRKRGEKVIGLKIKGVNDLFIFRKELVDIAVLFMKDSGEYIVESDGCLGSPFVLKNDDRMAIVMPLRLTEDEVNFNIQVEGMYAKAGKSSIRMSAAFIAYDKDGKIFGVYNKKDRAQLAAGRDGKITETTYEHTV